MSQRARRHPPLLGRPWKGPCAQAITYAVITLPHADKTYFIDGYRRALPGERLHLLHAVNGRNASETIGEWVASGLALNDVSRGGRNWGKVATFITRYKQFSYQVAHRIPVMLTLEDDLLLRRPFGAYAQRACAVLQANPTVDLLQLSMYGEVMMSSLSGATRIVDAMRRTGMVKSDDQQLTNSAVMGHHVRAPPFACLIHCYRVQQHGRNYSDDDERQPWRIGRRTNLGDIHSSAALTWAELMLLRLLTRSPRAREPQYGVPAGAEVGIDPYRTSKWYEEARARARERRRNALKRRAKEATAGAAAHAEPEA